MSALSRVRGSMFTGNNENTVALANLNFDFSLFKLEAPSEFQPLGSVLSEWRKSAAETGQIHQTARKLGALFEGVATPSENLFRTYGNRVSEISSPESGYFHGFRHGGAFEKQAGLDGTAIWAAATSGKSAMGANLLACMLARLWTSAQATAIWVELVDDRKREIRRQCDGSEPSHIAPLLATDHTITRKELAEWDASARAWIESADGAKRKQHIQLKLIIDNLTLPVDNNQNVYRSVLHAWKTAMKTVDDLVRGIPQVVQSGAVLLALSSWHLYPDMDVFGRSTKTINQRDTLISEGGRLTVGLEDSRPGEGNGVYWSLSLAHLRYYGNPVLARRSVGTDASRIAFEELGLVVIGCLLRLWDLKDSHMLLANIFLSLSDYVESTTSQPDDPMTIQDKQRAQYFMLKPSSWMHLLFDASRLLASSEGDEHARNLLLVKTAMRRGSVFLGTSGPSRMFGLCDSTTIISSMKDENCGIQMLRTIAKERRLANCKTVIRYLNKTSNKYEIATVFPEPRTSKKRRDDGTEWHEKIHYRWIDDNDDDDFVTTDDDDDDDDDYDDDRYDHDENFCHPNVVDRRVCIEDSGEICLTYDSTRVTYSSDDNTLSWYRPPTILVPQTCLPLDIVKNKRASPSKTDVGNFRPQQVAETNNDPNLDYPLADSFLEWEEQIVELNKWDEEQTVHYRLLLGNADTMALFVSHEDTRERELVDKAGSKLSLSELLTVIKLRTLSVSKLLRTFIDQLQDFPTFAASLKAWSSAAAVYKILPGASVSLQVISHTLADSAWTTRFTRLLPYHIAITAFVPFHLSRSETFSCVALFETGTLQISPDQLEHVMAMSSGNSIYAAAHLLCDPIEDPTTYELRRITGNLGRGGITMLIPPENPNTRDPGYDTWNLVNHLAFDGKIEDCFENTSMHLSFTGYEQPIIEASSHGAQDAAAIFLETLLSVHDSGKWVGDLDILKTMENPRFRRWKTTNCGHKQISKPPFPATAVDNWYEILDKPDGVGIVRARTNWLARLAVASICVQRGEPVLVLPEDICWHCIADSQEPVVEPSSMMIS